MSPKVRFSFYESVLGKCALVWGGEGVLRNFLPFESPSETQNEVLNEFAEAVELHGKTRWSIHLLFNHTNQRHAMGRIRLSLSGRLDAPVEVGTID